MTGTPAYSVAPRRGPSFLRALAAVTMIALIVMAVAVTWAAVKLIDRAPEVDRVLTDAHTATQRFNNSADDIAPTLRELRRVTRQLDTGSSGAP
jgi:hypothetical protein